MEKIKCTIERMTFQNPKTIIAFRSHGSYKNPKVQIITVMQTEVDSKQYL